MSESEFPTQPHNEIPSRYDDPGSYVIANLIDEKLGKFLENQEERDRRLFEMVSKIANEMATVVTRIGVTENNHEAMKLEIQALKRRVEELEARLCG